MFRTMQDLVQIEALDILETTAWWFFVRQVASASSFVFDYFVSSRENTPPCHVARTQSSPCGSEGCWWRDFILRDRRQDQAPKGLEKGMNLSHGVCKCAVPDPADMGTQSVRVVLLRGPESVVHGRMPAGCQNYIVFGQRLDRLSVRDVLLSILLCWSWSSTVPKRGHEMTADYRLNIDSSGTSRNGPNRALIRP